MAKTAQVSLKILGHLTDAPWYLSNFKIPNDMNIPYLDQVI